MNSKLKLVFVGIMAIGATGFLLMGGTEGQITGIVSGLVAVIAAISILWKLIKGAVK